MKKFQTTMTFDRELELIHSITESCSKWRNEACGQ